MVTLRITQITRQRRRTQIEETSTVEEAILSADEGVEVPADQAPRDKPGIGPARIPCAVSGTTLPRLSGDNTSESSADV